MCKVSFKYELLLEDSQCKYDLCRLYVCRRLCLLCIAIIFTKVHMDLVDTKTKLSMMPINFQNSHITRVDTLVSMTTKGNECWIGQKETNYVLYVIS